MKKKVTLLFSILAAITIQHGFSQTGLRTINSGLWSDTLIWEKTGNIYNPTPTWGHASSPPTSNQSVFIRNGHTVTTDGTKSCLNLTIETGGQLFANLVANTLRVGQPSQTVPTGGTIDTLTADGILGGPGEIFPLELPVGAASLWIRGAGSIEIGRIRPTNGNLNFPGSAAANALPGARLIIDKDIKLNVVNNYAFSLTNSGPTANDSISFTIKAGRTVTIADPTSYFHNNGVSAGVVSSTGGNYVYNINGTLDLSANPSTTGGSSLIPYGNALSSITLNVSGLLKLGGYFKADTVGNSLGALYMNINNGGLIDATLTSKLITGTIGAVTITPNIFFVESGNGALKRTVPNDGTKVKFEIGTSLTSHTPVTINSTSGPAETYKINVKNTFDHTPPAQTIMKQWDISEGTAGGNSDTLRFSWTTADEAGSGFVHGGTIYVLRWNGTAWVSTVASISGTGTLLDPWVAKIGGVSAFSQFAVSSFSVVSAFTWIGIISSDWSAGANWSTGVAPTVTDDIFIPSGTPNSANIKNLYVGHCKSVTVNNGAVVTVSTGGELKVGL